MKLQFIQQVVEFFHLVFLSNLGQRIDKNLYVLKGGCNLRFFTKSIRYSEDLDLDAQIMSKETLLKNVDTILKSLPMRRTLQSHGVRVDRVLAPKQTETTHRWKIQLSVDERNLPIQTKIEFSRREFSGKYEFRPVDPTLVRQYDLYPVSINHYVEETALVQKILALAHRKETQARDLFDLFFLIERSPHFNSKIEPVDLAAAKENSRGISFDDYKGQVLPFLMVQYQQQYSSQEIWQEMQRKVLEFLEGQ